LSLLLDFQRHTSTTLRHTLMCLGFVGRVHLGTPPQQGLGGGQVATDTPPLSGRSVQSGCLDVASEKCRRAPLGSTKAAESTGTTETERRVPVGHAQSASACSPLGSQPMATPWYRNSCVRVNQRDDAGIRAATLIRDTPWSAQGGTRSTSPTGCAESNASAPP